MDGIYTCNPCSDPYWGSLAQGGSHLLTGTIVGGILGFALSYGMKGEVHKMKTEFITKFNTGGWNKWITNPITHQPHHEKLRDITMTTIKCSFVGLAIGTVSYAIQLYTRAFFCTDYEGLFSS